jgi:hypothetical protein
MKSLLRRAQFSLSPCRVQLLLLALSTIYYLLYFNYQIDLDDEGLLLWEASDLLHGTFPIADYASYMPLSYFVLAALFKTFGTYVVVERLFLIAFLLACGQMTLAISRRFLPGAWALLPAILYALAPGPWYKVVFVWSILLIGVGAFFWLDRPTFQRAVLFGISIGVAGSGRIEAGVIGAALAAGASTLLLIDRWRARATPERPNELLILAVTLVAALVTVGMWIPIYAAFGKIDGVISFLRDEAFAPLAPGIVQKQGGMTLFNPASLLAHPTLEQAFYAGGVASTLGLSLSALPSLFSGSRSKRLSAISTLILCALSFGSMTYTFLYVWNSRMLSTFAIVYIAYTAAAFRLAGWLTTKLNRRYEKLTATIGACLAAILVASVLRFAAEIDFYSGSITTRLPPTVTVTHPLLRAIHVNIGQTNDISRLMEEVASAPPDATIVSMSEATTMGFLSGLHNPTKYRVFVREFAIQGEEQRAIATIDRLMIDFLVARRSQFLSGGGFSSNLAAYAPELRAYLIRHYDIVPLGSSFVLLRRRNQ